MIVYTAGEIEKYAETFVQQIIRSSGEKEKATVVGLSGELGAGKTTFVKAVAKSFGLTQTVTSPTFVIEKIYQIDNNIFSKLIHIDAYRLKGGSELQNLGWDNIISDSKNIIFIEWPEMVTEILPNKMTHLTFEVVSEVKRKITVEL